MSKTALPSLPTTPAEASEVRGSELRSTDGLAAGDGCPQRYWECECCGSLLVTNKQDDASEYQCPQCARVKCEHGGRYVELSLSAFAKRANIVAVKAANTPLTDAQRSV